MSRISVVIILLAACTAEAVTPTTLIDVRNDDGEIVQVSRPVACPTEPGSAIDLDSEPAFWLVNGKYMRWETVAGCPVRVDVIAHLGGPDHCGWERAEFLTISDEVGKPFDPLDAAARRYVWNEGGVINGFEPAVTRAVLPVGVVDTDFIRDGEQLFVHPDDDSRIWLLGPNQAREFVLDQDNVTLCG